MAYADRKGHVSYAAHLCLLAGVYSGCVGLFLMNILPDVVLSQT